MKLIQSFSDNSVIALDSTGRAIKSVDHIVRVIEDTTHLAAVESKSDFLVQRRKLLNNPELSDEDKAVLNSI
jgi:hypothetical protein